MKMHPVRKLFPLKLSGSSWTSTSAPDCRARAQKIITDAKSRFVSQGEPIQSSWVQLQMEEIAREEGRWALVVVVTELIRHATEAPD